MYGGVNKNVQKPDDPDNEIEGDDPLAEENIDQVGLGSKRPRSDQNM